MKSREELRQEIQSLRDSALQALRNAHDYHEHTRAAWKIVEDSVQQSEGFELLNPATGNRTASSQLVEQSRLYLQREHPRATFQLFLSLFENFFFDLLRLWWATFPEGLRKKELSFGLVLDSTTREQIIQAVVEKEIYALSYKSPLDWFRHVEQRICGSKSRELLFFDRERVLRFAEAKATRDVLAHGRGIVDAVYVQKAGPFSRFQPGEELEIWESYHRQVWENLVQLLEDTASLALGKLRHKGQQQKSQEQSEEATAQEGESP